MNKKLLGLFLGACFCAIFCGCGNVKIDSGTITGQPSLAVEELGSDIAAGAKPETVDSYEELKNGVNKFALNKIAARWPAKAVAQLSFSQ